MRIIATWFVLWTVLQSCAWPVSLDISTIIHPEFIVESRQECTLIRRVYRPRGKFSVDKVSCGRRVLWNAREKDQCVNVKVSSRGSSPLFLHVVYTRDGLLDDYYGMHKGEWLECTEDEYGEALERERLQTLNIGSLSPCLVTMHKIGDPVYENILVSNRGCIITKVVSDANLIWEAERGEHLIHSSLFLENDRATLLHLDSSSSGAFYRLYGGLWERINKRDFKKKSELIKAKSQAGNSIININNVEDAISTVTEYECCSFSATLFTPKEDIAIIIDTETLICKFAKNSKLIRVLIHKAKSCSLMHVKYEKNSNELHTCFVNVYGSWERVLDERMKMFKMLNLVARQAIFLDIGYPYDNTCTIQEKGNPVYRRIFTPKYIYKVVRVIHHGETIWQASGSEHLLRARVYLENGKVKLLRVEHSGGRACYKVSSGLWKKIRNTTFIQKRKMQKARDSIKGFVSDKSISHGAIHSGSLVSLNTAECSDAHMHMYHLYHKKEPGVHEYLVNMLYTKRTNDEISFYLPQLCQLSIKKYGMSSLHRFLLDRASGSMHFALQLSWFYQAVLDDQMSKYGRLSQKITQETEMAVVNCKLITPSSFMRPQTDAEMLASPNLLNRRLVIKSLNKDVYTDVNSLLIPQMPHSLVHNTFTLSCPNSKVKLKGVHTKLGNPLNLETHPSFDGNDEMFLELQRLMMKQRRLDYFNLLNNFVSLSMEVSLLLTTEPKRDAREPLLRVFASALNEWMLLRRCTVAAYEESFSYTGLSLPLKFLSHLNDRTPFQMLRIVESEIKVFFSRKRAPFVFYIEFANLDEDVGNAGMNGISNGMDGGMDGTIKGTMKDLYVFDAIVQDLLNYEILTPSHIAIIKDPLESIRYALGMLSPEQMAAYTEAVTARDEETMHSETSDTDTPTQSHSGMNNGNLGHHSGHHNDHQNEHYDHHYGVRSGSSLSLNSLTPDDTRAVIWPETFEVKKERIRKASPYGHLKSWHLCALFVKGGDDFLQENMSYQVINLFSDIFKRAKLPLWLRPIDILVTGPTSGIMEFLHDTCSVDVIKRRFNTGSIATAFEKLFADNIYEARKNFIESHAAYSLVSYLLHVKDKHNGNIMLDSKGHAIHIDYGFCLTNSPGNINFEATSFKLTNEYMDIIGGESSDNFAYFRTLVISGLLEARKHVDQIVLLVEMMASSKMPCFFAGTMYTIEALKDRFMLNLSEEACRINMESIISSSVGDRKSTYYDYYQRLTNGIR